MRLRLSRSWLFALALVLGQWLTLAHAFEHPALAADAACQICAHGQGLDSGAIAPSVGGVALALASEAPSLPPLVTPTIRATRICLIRGPPVTA